jgi:hypothetical protein
MPNLQVKKAEEMFDDAGHPFINLTLGEWPMAVPAYLDQDPMAQDNGWVFLGEQYDFLPILVCPPDPANGRTEPRRVKGFTDDQAVVYLVHRGNDKIETEHEFGGEISHDALLQAFSAREHDPLAGKQIDPDNLDAHFGGPQSNEEGSP